MKTTTQRTELLLDPEQHRLLTEIAQHEKRSLSDIVREMLRNQLEIRECDSDARKQQRLQALEQIRQHREQMLERRGGVPLDVEVVELINQMRDERDEELVNNAIATRD